MADDLIGEAIGEAQRIKTLLQRASVSLPFSERQQLEHAYRKMGRLVEQLHRQKRELDALRGRQW